MTFDELTSGPCALPKAPVVMPTQILERQPTEQLDHATRWNLARWFSFGQRGFRKNPA
ncbi:hypothetical protein [uncultured Cohaesibacter sp.]|uniref:hypothetical protein n=1 Tax=uncultured Cohaesibacter sp. TaxID=1002546 RepID=UPI0029C6197B|nr:hypothetical protein [uncultured Cohaesibacter sp.]